MKMTGDRFGELIADLETAVTDLTRLVRGDAELWSRGLPDKWNAAQHADHLAIGFTISADRLEASERLLREGALPKRPWRGPLQALFVAVAVGAGRLPRGGRTPAAYYPKPRPDRDDALGRIARDLVRHRDLGERLSADERDRLWIPNPYRGQWHYTYSEALRMNAVHFRHHTRQIEEIAAAATRPG